MSPRDGDARQPERRKTVTIYDIAKEAGVAPSTVSRALSRPGRVSNETAERIHLVAERLGYKRTTPHRRHTSTDDNFVIALVIADVGNPYFSQLMIGLQENAAPRGYTVLLLDSRENAAEEKEAIHKVLHLIDGIVLSASRMTSATIQQFNRSVPVVSLNRQVPGVTSIVPNSAQGMHDVVEYLVEHGHRELTYLAGPTGSWANGARWEGLTRACVELGVRTHRIGPFPPTVVGGIRAVDTWSEHPTTAVIGYNDVLAIGFMKSALARGIHVPDDVSVVGIDNAGLAVLTEPGLTSLTTGARRLGSAAAAAIIGHLRHRSQPQPLLTTLDVTLKTRDSVGPAHPERLALFRDLTQRK